MQTALQCERLYYCVVPARQFRPVLLRIELTLHVVFTQSCQSGASCTEPLLCARDLGFPLEPLRKTHSAHVCEALCDASLLPWVQLMQCCCNGQFCAKWITTRHLKKTTAKTTTISSKMAQLPLLTFFSMSSWSTVIFSFNFLVGFISSSIWFFSCKIYSKGI